MRVDWSTAEVVSRNEALALRVNLVDVPGGQPYDDAFKVEASRWGGSLGDERRTIDRYSSGMHGWGVEIWPIDGDDIDGEKRRLEEFVERINQKAQPQQEAYEEDHRRKRAEAEDRERRAKELTERFRD